MGRAVTEFNKTHPSICVTQEDVGAGDPEYVKISDAVFTVDVERLHFFDPETGLAIG